MALAESLLPEFDHEMGNTRRLLELVPEKDAGWKPHPKSWALGELAVHLANLPSWAGATLKQTEFDLNPKDAPAPTARLYTTTAAVLDEFDTKIAEARAAIEGTSDADFMVAWTLKDGGKSVFSLPRIAVMRSFVMNHIIHHRGQLTVYLRLRNVPLPNIYGPTADTAG